MNDPYISSETQIDRLVNEWVKYGRLIVAYDFDNTVFDYHNKNYSFPAVINQLNTLGRMGCYMICFTSCDNSRFPEIRSYLRENSIPCHGINIDSEIVPFKGRKIYYNVFYDDRSGLGQVVDIMGTVMLRVGILMREKAREIHNRNNWNNFTEIANGRVCAYSNKPILRGDWYFENKYPCAYNKYREENDTIPSAEDIMNLFSKY